MAGRRCTVCDHEAIVTINRLIAENRVSKSGIARDYAVSEDSVDRHAKNHIPAILSRAVERKQQKLADSMTAVVERATATQTAVADEFLEDIQYSKRFAKLGVERCMSGTVDPGSGEVAKTPIEEFRLAPGFLASLDRANSLLGQATGRLSQASAGSSSVNLVVVMPRAIDAAPHSLPPGDVVDVQAISEPPTEPSEPLPLVVDDNTE